MKEFVCARCGVSFQGVGERRFCSPACSDQTWAEARTTWITYHCAACGQEARAKPFQSKRRFCSKSCATRWHNAQRALALPPKPTKPCEVCGAPIQIEATKAERQRFCSRACKGEYRRGKPSAHRLAQGEMGPCVTGFRPDLGQFFRSRWEANYARYLRHAGHAYLYEPHRFTVALSDGTTHAYTPDFLIDGSHYVEVKGWLRQDRRQAEVIAAASEQLPLPLILLSGDMYRALAREHKRAVPGWEHPGDPKPDLPKRYCPICGTLVTSIFRRTRFCSRACFGASCAKPKQARTCPTCGAGFEVSPYQESQRYCSQSCAAQRAHRRRPRDASGHFA